MAEKSRTVEIPLASEMVSKAVGAILKAAFAAAGDASAPFDAWAAF